MWIDGGFSVCSKQHLNQIPTHNSAHSKGDQDVHCEFAAPLQIPTVSFDLGNEWDEWSDFDDDKLVHASETLFDSRTANDKPQIQEFVDFNVSGNVILEVIFLCLRNRFFK